MTGLIFDAKQNIDTRNTSDRIMWFSMWFLITISTFGIVGPLMVYILVKRRNDHFKRQAELKKIVLNHLEEPSVKVRTNSKQYGVLKNQSEKKEPVNLRNARLWAFSSILIFPTIYVLYFLTKDLYLHQQDQYHLFTEVASRIPSFKVKFHPQDFKEYTKSWKRYFVLTLLTFGLASIYWLYKIFNNYNSHFKNQWKNEDGVLHCLENNV